VSPQGDEAAHSDAYRAAGVDYDVLDAAKRRSLAAVVASLENTGGAARVLPETVGEPAQLVEVGGLRLATVLECLGTKSTICREVEDALGLDLWEAVGVDSVSAIVNDLACVGAVPLTVSAYVATGSASWYSGSRHDSLVRGWASACARVGAAWVGGESPTLQGVVHEDSVDLAGSALGLVTGEPWLGSRIEPGDEIVLVASNGLHANGASLARRIAASRPEGWAAPLPSGRAFGEAVLDPSALYVDLVRGVKGVHYGSHITGHGLRKLMRADRALTYRIERLPPVPEVLSWLAAEAGLDDAAAYGTFNMGAGYALFLPAGEGERAASQAVALGHSALLAGRVEAGPRRVVLEPVGVTYGSEELELR
jgi:phosphoribosylformylglycinamidine cyclo-ligase